MRRLLKKINTKLIIALLVVSIATPSSLLLLPKKTEAAGIPATACIAKFFGFAATSTSADVASTPGGVPVGQAGGTFQRAQTTGASQSNFIKDCVEHGFALAIAKMLLAEMTNEIVKWINSGFRGSPAFLSDPEKMFENLGDQIIGDFILGSPLAFLCSPFKIQVQLALLLNFKGGGFNQRAKCTLSQVIKNVDNFLLNFDQGGWTAWFSMTQVPTNNAIGSFLEAKSALGLQINGKSVMQKDMLNWGNGFLSYSTCDDGSISYGGVPIKKAPPATAAKKPAAAPADDNPFYSGPSQGGPVIQDAPASVAAAPKCTINTPGTIIQDQLKTTLGPAAGQLGLADDFDKILNALGSQLFQQFISSAKGLLAGKQDPSTGQSSKEVETWINKLKAQANKSGQKAQDSSDKIDQQAQDIVTATEAATPGDPDPAINLAMQKRIVSNSIVADHPASKANDGDTFNTEPSTDGDGNTFVGYTGYRSRPADPYAPFLMIDIGKDVTIGKVSVYPETNRNPLSLAAAAAALHFHVEIYEQDPTSVDPTTSQITVDSSQPHWRSESIAQDYRNVHDFKVPAQKGRFIIVQADVAGKEFNVAEVEIHSYAKPTITLVGQQVVTTPRNSTYVDAGATAKDNADLPLPVTVSNPVDVSNVGSYVVTYTATDSNGGTASTTRQVIVN